MVSLFDHDEFWMTRFNTGGSGILDSKYECWEANAGPKK